MPYAISLLLLFLCAFVIWRLAAGRPGPRCRWRRDPLHNTGGAQRYLCRSCGADAFTRNGAPPANCHRAARNL